MPAALKPRRRLHLSKSPLTSRRRIPLNCCRGPSSSSALKRGRGLQSSASLKSGRGFNLQLFRSRAGAFNLLFSFCFEVFSGASIFCFLEILPGASVFFCFFSGLLVEGINPLSRRFEACLFCKEQYLYANLSLCFQLFAADIIGNKARNDWHYECQCPGHCLMILRQSDGARFTFTICIEREGRVCGNVDGNLADLLPLSGDRAQVPAGQSAKNNGTQHKHGPNKNGPKQIQGPTTNRAHQKPGPNTPRGRNKTGPNKKRGAQNTRAERKPSPK